MNNFIACSSVLQGHAILLRPDGDLVYSGPLSGITETQFNLASRTLVSPDTLRWIKDRADEAIRNKKARLI